MIQQTTVIIADDHPLFRKGLREVLESDPGIRVLAEAGEGLAALRMIEEFTPEMAILDIDMKHMGGLAVAREVQQQGMPVDILFLTLYKEEDLFNEAMDLGARAYVLKDSAVEDILNAIRTVAEGRYFISPCLTDHLVRRSERASQLLRRTPSLDDLTPAEWRVLRLIAEGKTSKEIADILSISFKTVENHRSSIAARLHIRGSHSLLKFAIEHKDALGRR